MEKVTYTVVSTALRNGPTSGIVVVEFHIETPTLLGRVPAKKLWMSERENGRTERHGNTKTKVIDSDGSELFPRSGREREKILHT